MTYSILVTISFFTLFFSSVSQAETPDLGTNTEYLAAGVSSPTASIEDVDWISGYWQGEIWGGQFEEIWSKPAAGSMMASFKFTESDQVKFYELLTISEHQGSLLLQLKHFSDDLKGWEEKDQSMNFKLVRLTDNAVFFEGYTYKLINHNEIHVFVVVENGGKKQETKFVFKRHI
ncbi:DUF6265 family protein [Paraglaciecola arctica]|uniref:DUF6265 family protein n=1 Tax=Paraglaciecola arctica TaxID=1128911 RepID=UPI001C066FB3|nr:DUF6265 family protein [Paraglaciecola arctica]MBU3005626.1 hypothetical protein [Paraglaciecola arctica]